MMREAPAAEASPVASMADVARGNIRSGAKDKSAGLTATPESKLRVLGREGAYVRVRDTSGNEGWIDADAL
jgi:uncharacterized protein YgiM (DUF1202 family)